MRGAKILPLPSFANAAARRWPPNAIGAAEEQFSKASILAQKPTAARKRERERDRLERPGGRAPSCGGRTGNKADDGRLCSAVKRSVALLQKLYRESVTVILHRNFYEYLRRGVKSHFTGK